VIIIMKFCLYGNPTIDVIITKEFKRVTYGGGVYYSALPLIKRGFTIEVYSVFNTRLIKHPIASYIVKSQYSSRTNIFNLEYIDNSRVIRVLEKAPAIYSWNSHEDYCYTVVNPVIGEIDISLLKLVRTKSQIIALDIQGFVRDINTKGIIFLKPIPHIFEALMLADIIHADLEEALCLVSGHGDLRRGLSMITREARSIVVVTSGSTRILIAHQGVVREINVSGEYTAIEKTGAGDYFLTAFLLEYLNSNDPFESVYKAHMEVTEWLMNRDRELHRTLTTQRESS